MKVKWKKVFLWSSLGSVALGATVAFARKSRKAARSRVEYRPLPPGSGVKAQTEVFVEEGKPAQDTYQLTPTSFRVWSVLELQSEPGTPNPAGKAIYHVTLTRGGATAAAAAGERLLERFYGTIRSVEPGGAEPRRDCIAGGAFLEIPRCYVGGAANGIESGEVHRSRAPILDFTLEPDLESSADQRPL